MAAQKKTAAKKAIKTAGLEAVATKADKPKAAPKVVAKTATKTSTPVRTIAAPATRLVEVGADRAREAYTRAKATSERIHQTLTETAAVTTRGALEINGKVLEAWGAQSDAAFALWRQALGTGSLSEAVLLQANGARRIYETAATHWKDVAETTTRWLGDSVKPLRAALTNEAR